MKTSNLIPLGAKEVQYQLDTTGLPFDAIIELTTEVSEDVGKTWRVHGSASVRKGDMAPGDAFIGAGVAFTEGNKNPDFLVRTTAKIGGVESGIPLVDAPVKVL